MKAPKPRRKRKGAARGPDDERRYPIGKALARIEYFETRRGMSDTREQEGRVVCEPPRRGSRKAAVSASAARNPYAGAVRRKLAAATFAASANLPVWRELGPTSIPHGQTYGSGPGSRPSVSGRCVGIVVDPTNPERLVLCSAGGGIWGSTTGACWMPLTDFEPTLSMGAIAAAPSSPNILTGSVSQIVRSISRGSRPLSS